MTLPRPPVFISYKRKDADTERLLAVLEPLLKPRFDLRIDRTFIGMGDRWRARILTELHAARAAIVVLSPAALSTEGDWVPFEASTLVLLKSAGATTGKDLPLIPVRLPGVSSADLDRPPFTNVAFRELQEVKVADLQDTTLQTVCEQIRQRLEALVTTWPQTPMEELEILVASRLKDVNEGVAADALADLSATEDPPPADVPRALARALLGTSDLDGYRKAFTRLIAWLKPHGPEVLARTLPFVWVPREAARSALDPQTGRLRSAVWTPARDIERTPADVTLMVQPATAPAPFTQITRGEGEDASADLVDQVRRLVQGRQPPRQPARSDDQLRAWLAREAARGDPLRVAVVASHAADVEPLLSAWPGVQLFVLCEDGIGSTIPCLTPPVDATAEDAAWEVRTNLDDKIRAQPH